MISHFRHVSVEGVIVTMGIILLQTHSVDQLEQKRNIMDYPRRLFAVIIINCINDLKHWMKL